MLRRMSLPGAYPAGPPTYAPATPPPGWYVDHAGQRWLWWDGFRWVDPAAPVSPSERKWFPDIRPLRWPAAMVGIAFVVAITVASRLITVTSTGTRLLALGVLVVSTIGMPMIGWYSSS